MLTNLTFMEEYTIRKIIIFIGWLTLSSCGAGNNGNDRQLIEGAQPVKILIAQIDNLARVKLGDGVVLGEEPSGLAYQFVGQKEYLWLVDDGTSKLTRLLFDEGENHWVNKGSWALKSHLVDSALDSEGVTLADDSSSVAYVASERLTNNRTKSRLAVTAYDTASSTTINEWDLTHDVANAESVDVAVGANEGIEGITWIPDADLIKLGFVDRASCKVGECKVYSPDDYGEHGKGLFVISVEGDPKNDIKPEIYLFALLDHGGFRKVSKIETQMKRIVGLEYDRATHGLWVHCDNVCDNKTLVYRIGGDGQFGVISEYEIPDDHRDKNYEGIAINGSHKCIENNKSIFMSNDKRTAAVRLVESKIPCSIIEPLEP